MPDGFRIIVQDEAAKLFFAGMMGHIDKSIRQFTHEYGSLMKRAVQENIRSQGQTFDSPWAAASKWIVAKKGRFKVLLEAIPHIHMRTSAQGIEVYFQSPGDWTLTQHEEGFVVPPSGERETIDVIPGALGKTSGKFSWIARRPSVVPARRIWPTEEQQWRYAAPLLEQWADRMARTAPGVTP